MLRPQFFARELAASVGEWNKLRRVPTLFAGVSLSAQKKKSTTPPEIVALYDKLIATMPEVERKGDANPYTSLNGNMFTLLNPPGRLAIRLSEADREKFRKKYKTGLFEAYGAVMKEYVAVPEELLSKTKELQPYLRLSYAYAKTLKPKPTKKK
jgi:TfoX/Sxy family transcriptional regulator of competence genes